MPAASAPPQATRPSGLRAALLTMAVTFGVGAGLGLLATWVRGPAPTRSPQARNEPQAGASAGSPPAQGAPAVPAWPSGMVGATPAPPVPAGKGPGTATDLLASLHPLGERVTSCAAASTGGKPGIGRMVVMLQMETLEGRALVADASPQLKTPASERVMACVRAEMVGKEVPMPQARPGGKLKTPIVIRY